MEAFENIIKLVDQIQHGSITCSPHEAHVISLFDLSHEHSKAVFHLHKMNLYGSAFALIRSCIESYIRGVWLRDCATEQQGKNVWAKDGKWLSFQKMLTEIDSHNEMPFFESKYKKSFGTMSSLTHGLGAQSSTRLRQKALKFSPSDTELTELLKEGCFLSIIANTGIAEIVKDEENISALENIYKQFLEI